MLQGLTQSPQFEVISYIASGLVDSFNPCNLTLLIFIAAFLVFTAFSSAELTTIGSMFIASFFVSNLLLQFGYFETLRAMDVYFMLTQILNIFVGALALILGAVNFVDWWKISSGSGPQNMLLKVPALSETKTGFENWPGALKYGVLSVAAMLGGWVICLLNSACLGQIYYSLMSTIMGSSGKRFQMNFALICYTICLIVPILTVFLILRGSLASGKFTRFMEQHLSKVKIIFSAAFFAVGVGLIFTFTR